MATKNQNPIGKATAKLPNAKANTDYTILKSDLLKGFSDPDSAGFTGDVRVFLAHQSNGDNGYLFNIDNDKFIFTPDKGFTGQVTISYMVKDKQGAFVLDGQKPYIEKLSFNVLSDKTKSADSIFTEQGDGIIEAGLMRVLAGFANAAYSVQDWENKIINDPSPVSEKILLKLKEQGWQTVDLDIENLNKDSYVSVIDHSKDKSGKYQNSLYEQTDQMNNGFYTNKNAAALVARCDDAIVISFRGTNDNGKSSDDSNNVIHPDVDQWGDTYYNAAYSSTQNHYDLFAPLLEKFDAYVKDPENGIKKVYVTGHSLGGAIAINYMNTHLNDSKYQGITFAAPSFVDGYTIGIPDRKEFDTNAQLTQVEITLDPVPQTWDVSTNQPKPGIVLEFAGNQTAIATNDYTKGNTIGFYGNPDYHSVDYYQGITKSIDASSWSVITESKSNQKIFFQGRELRDGNFVIDGMKSTDNKLASGVDDNSSGTLNSIDAYQSTYYSFNPNVLYGGRGKDVLKGDIDDELLIGGSNNDALLGGGGNDTLIGGDGVDKLTGGEGTDKMTGGAGNDIFYFDFKGGYGLSTAFDSNVGSLRDVITDFISGADKIDLSAIDAKRGLLPALDNTNDKFTFIGNKKLSDAGQLSFSNGILSASIESNGATAFEIALSGVKSVVASDFIL